MDNSWNFIIFKLLYQYNYLKTLAFFDGLLKKQQPWLTNEVRKNGSEKRTSEKPVITPAFEKADSLTGGSLQVNGNRSLSEIDQDDRR